MKLYTLLDKNIKSLVNQTKQTIFTYSQVSYFTLKSSSNYK